MRKAWIGASGWNYKHWWNGVFYDKELKPAQWLRFYARHFNTVEINNSFYRLPSSETFENWQRQVPAAFTFAVKASRFLTHMKRLQDPKASLDLFFSRAVHLGNRMGPILFQLPPKFKIDLARLETFLDALEEHDNGRSIRSVIEFRDASWMTEKVYQLLSDRRTALCIADWRDLNITGPVTTDFVYVRRHGGRGKSGNYGRRALNHDVENIHQWLARGLDVYVYFNNDLEGHAIHNARYVRHTLTASYWNAA